MKKLLVLLALVAALVVAAAMAEEVPPCPGNENGHTINFVVGQTPPTCSESGWQLYGECQNEGCDYVHKQGEIPATGKHEYVEGKCECGAEDPSYVPPCPGNANGHTINFVVGQTPPTCSESGWQLYGECQNEGCDYVHKRGEIPATGEHSFEDGAPTCKWCDEPNPDYVAPKPPVVIPKPPVVTPEPTPEPTPVPTPNTWLYSNTMTSFGPTTRELVGGKDWHRVTPVDVSVDGVYTYDLIASDRYVVGTVTFTVEAGTLTVSYKVKANPSDVTDEQLKIYASKADLAEGKAVDAKVDEAINIAENFGADTKLIVSLILTGDYDSAGHYVVGMSVNKADIDAMIANMD